MNRGRVDVTLEPETVAEVISLVEQIEQRLPFLLRLDTQEKQRLVKPRSATAQVIQEVAEMQREAGIPVADDDAMLADLTVFNGLTSITDRVTELLRLLKDTRLQAGSEGWSEVLIRYGMLRKAERRQPELKTRLDRVQSLIAGRPRRAPEDELSEDIDEVG